MHNDDRILIIGGGPVGTVTGLALARAGIPVTVFDRYPEPATDHRAATLQPSTLDLFAPLGLTDEIIRQGIESPIFQWRDRLRDEVVAEFDYRMLADDSDYPFVIQLEQHKTIHIALEAALKEPLFNLIRPVEVIAVRQSADHVEADVQREDGSVETHRGRWLIGCDGGRSLVRKSIGASFEGFTWAERFNIVASNKDFEGYGFRYRNYVAHPDRWCALMKVPGENHEGVWRCLFPAHEDESDEYVMSDAWIRARFAECLPGDPDGFEIIHRNMYTVQQRVAGTFRGGRMILAGDAAHVNNPVGGMGMNSGFQDGLNLAGKLIQIWQGAPADPLLDRYDRQRRLTAIKYVQAQSIANKKTLDEKDPALRQQKLDDLRRQAADKAAALEFVRRASLVAMYRESESIE
jgi:3-(3-hydroxy-phenyl)propionate hydroxylase